MTALQGHSHNHIPDPHPPPRGANGVQMRGQAAAWYSSHGSFTLRAVQASPV